MFIKLFKPNTPSNRFKKKISSCLSSKCLHDDIKLQFFKKKIKKCHKFLSNSNSIFRVNSLNPVLVSSVLVNYIKVSYKNSFLGFFKTFDNSIFLKKLCYGFSYLSIYNNLDFKRTHAYSNILSNSTLGCNSLRFFYLMDIGYGSKFFSLHVLNSSYRVANSAGTYCSILHKDFSNFIANVQLPSKINKFFDFFSTAYCGRSSNIFSKYYFFSTHSSKFKLKKKRISVRGVAKNPVDHQNGGRSKIKHPFLNPWGKVAKNNK